MGCDINFSSNTVRCEYTRMHGGAIYNGNSTMAISGNNIYFNSNTAGYHGGAIYNIGSNSSMTISGNNIEFSSNTATGGGAIANSGGATMEIRGKSIKFSSNTAPSYYSSGGAIDNAYSTMTITGEKINFSYNTASYHGGAIYNVGSTLNLVSTGKIEFTGNTAAGISNAIHDNEGTINLYASKNAQIIFNDRITSTNNESILNINQSTTTVNAIGKIVLNENMQGYTGQVNLYAGTVQIGQYGTWFAGNTYVDNATIDMANFVLQEHNFNTLRVDNNLNLFVDVDLANKQMDTITASEDSDIQGKINIKSINILEDATEDRTEILFTSSTVLQDKITTVKTASSSLYKYNVNYNDLTGKIFFNKGINPIIAQSQVATAVGGVITQTAILNQAFKSIDSVIQNRKQRYYQSSNIYASTTNLLYEEPNKIERGLWIRPYAMQDTIDINNMSVDNTAVGTLAGLDLSVGEDSILSFYIGYAGSNQKYEDIKVNQTGYVVGATGMIIKDDYYLGLTANINFNKAQSENIYGTDNFDMNMYAVGAKAGYNMTLRREWILEPNITLMYGNINTQEFTTKQKKGVKIGSQSTNNILIEPQIKAKLDLTDGWTPYTLIGYVLNTGNKTELVANNLGFNDMKITGYAEYGLGVNKSFKDSFWSCFLQATGKCGNKNGFEGNFGIKYSFSNATKKQKKQDEQIEKLYKKQEQENKTKFIKEAQLALNKEKMSEKEAEELFKKAKAFYSKNQYLYSTDILQKIIVKYPSYDLANIYYNKIKNLMKRKIKSKYDNSFLDYSYWAGYKSYYEENYDKCQKEWERYLQFNSKNEEIKLYYNKVNKIVNDLIEEKNKKDFKFEVERMLKKGTMLYKNKQWVECIKQMEKVQEFIKKSKYANIAFNYYSLTKEYINKSVKELSKIFKENSNKEIQKEKHQEKIIDEKLADDKYNEGLILYAKGKYFEAEKMFELTLRLNPNHKKAQTALKRIKE